MRHRLTPVRIFAVVLLAACASAVSAQVITSAQIDELAARTMKTFDVPGMAVLVVKDDKIVHAKGYGVRSLKTGAPVDANTMFGIASNSKAFTAAALAILVDEKKLKWTDRVNELIPEFKMYNPYVTEEFTILDLLTHRSGLGLGAGDLMLFPDSSDFTRADIIHNLRYLKPVSGFRAKYDYDNNLYIVAGEVVARVSGMPYETFVEQRIMRPLGMTASAASKHRLKDGRNVVDPHVAIDGKVQAVDAEIGEVSNAAGGIYSNINELALWVRMQLAGGSYGQNQHLFSEQAQWTMWSPQTIIPIGPKPTPYNTHFMAYGLGWGLSDVKGYKQIAHTGGLIGIVTQVTLIPELKLGIVVLTNQQVGAAYSSISSTIKDSYLGMPVVDRVAELKKRVDAGLAEEREVLAKVDKDMAEAQARAVKVDLAPFAGVYRDSWFGDVTLTLKDGKLQFASKRSPRLAGPMTYFKGNTFIVKWTERSLEADAFVTFTLDQDGKPSGMTMAAISPLTDFSFDFQDLDFKVVK